MDTIRLDSPFDRIDFIKSNKIFWIITSKKHKKQWINYSIFSIVIIVIGLILKTESEPSNLFIFIGIYFLIFSIFMLLMRIHSWTAYHEKIKKIADKYDELKANFIFELSDDSVKYWDYEKHFDFKWSAFTHFTIYKEHIVLFVNNSMIGGFLFDKKDSEIDQYDKILELVKLKLEYKATK